MDHRERQPSEELIKYKEYSLKKGVQESVKRIKELLNQQQNVVIAITGSDTNVGKNLYQLKYKQH